MNKNADFLNVAGRVTHYLPWFLIDEIQIRGEAKPTPVKSSKIMHADISTVSTVVTYQIYVHLQ